MSQNSSIFIPKKAFKSQLKAVLEGLNVKFFFVAQRWWVTLFRQIMSWNLTLIIITNLTGLLAANWLQKLETKHCHCVYYAGYFCSYVWVFVSVWYGISVWFIYNRTKLTFCKCHSLSHIPNTSLQCSNQPLHYRSWTLRRG